MPAEPGRGRHCTPTRPPQAAGAVFPAPAGLTGLHRNRSQPSHSVDSPTPTALHCEPLEGPRTLQGLRHSLWVQSGVNCWGPAGPGSSRQQGWWLAVHDPRAAGEQTCPCRLASPRSAGAKDVPPGVQACPRTPGTLLGCCLTPWNQTD